MSMGHVSVSRLKGSKLKWYFSRAALCGNWIILQCFILQPCLFQTQCTVPSKSTSLLSCLTSSKPSLKQLSEHSPRICGCGLPRKSSSLSLVFHVADMIMFYFCLDLSSYTVNNDSRAHHCTNGQALFTCSLLIHALVDCNWIPGASMLLQWLNYLTFSSKEKAHWREFKYMNICTSKDFCCFICQWSLPMFTAEDIKVKHKV